MNYQYDNKHGVSKKFNEDGTLVKEENYLNDEIIKSNYYDEKGNLIKSERYFDENIYDIGNYQN
jgi:antitoxin component YwqK of YwqJK toxin-antitoxin module